MRRLGGRHVDLAGSQDVLDLPGNVFERDRIKPLHEHLEPRFQTKLARQMRKSQVTI
jgi:hypothetical protein